MTGETFDYRSVGEPGNKETRQQAIRDFITFTYTSWKAAISPYESQLLELRNNVYAVSTNTVQSGALPFSNNIVIPKLTQIRDVLHAKYMQSLFGAEPWFRWTSGDKSSAIAQKANMITSYINTKLEQQNALTTLSEIVRDWLDTGNCYAKIMWVNESYTLPTGEVVPGYVGPKIFRISHWDIVFNPQASKFKNSPKIIRSLKSIGELYKMAKESPQSGITIDMVKNLNEKNVTMYGSQGGLGLPDTQKSLGYSADGFSGYMFYMNFRYVEILEFFGDMLLGDEYLPNHHIVILNREYVLTDETLPSWTKTDYLYHAGWRTRPDNLYAQGPLDNILGMQYQLNKVTNLKADLQDQYSNPALVTIGEVEIEGNIGSPGQRFTVDADAKVEYLRPDAGVLNLETERGEMMALMEQMAIVPPESFGFRQPGEKTLGEVTLMNQGAQEAYNIKVKEFEMNFLEPLLNDFLEMARRNLNGTELVKMTDKQYDVINFITITKDDLQAVGNLKAVGSRYEINNIQLLQAITSLGQNQALMQMISPHISRLRLAEVLSDALNLEAYGIIKKDEGVVEDIETQEVMQAGSKMLHSANVAGNAPPDQEQSAINIPQQQPVIQPVTSGDQVV